jgi:outer membrane protein TolC
LPRFRSFAFALVLAAAPAAAQPASAPDYAAARLAPPACATPEPAAALTLADLVDLALCRAPATRAAWAAVGAAGFRQDQARALYGPRLDATVGPQLDYARSSGGGFPTVEDSNATASARLSVNWLLFDFGGREARLDAARAGIAGAVASFADQAQAVVLEAGLAYNATIAAVEAEAAARASLRFARVSLEAATARERAGVGIKSDRLQADAAYARALLQLRQAEGQAETQRGRLATAVSLPPTTRLTLAPPPALASAPALTESAEALIADAQRLRPDLDLSAASLASAEANVRLARAARRPSLSLGAGPGATVGTTERDLVSGSAGLTLSIPLGDAGGRTAAVREALSDAERAAAELDRARQQAALDVWSRYQTLSVDAANLDTARRLLASAEEAAALAQGRYRAGLATITELLDAQSSLAGAREQLVAAELGVRSSNLELARAVGRIGEAVETP